jgi:hypothetical protein
MSGVALKISPQRRADGGSMMISFQRSITSQHREYSSSILPDRQAKTSAAGSQTERRWLKR